LVSIDVSGNAITLKKKKTSSKMSGYSKHLSVLQRTASKSIDTVLKFIPTSTSGKGSPKKIYKPSGGGKDVKSAQLGSKGSKGSIKGKIAIHKAPVDYKSINAATVALRNRNRLLGSIVKVVSGCPHLKYIGLVKTGLDDACVLYLTSQLKKCLKHASSEGLALFAGALLDILLNGVTKSVAKDLSAVSTI
jgi:hypothetical protein